MTLRATDVSVSYGGPWTLRPVSLEVPAGQVLAVSGPSGAGKTTLLWALSGARPPDSGTVHVADAVVTDRTGAAALGVALVPQGNGLAAVLSAYENVVVPVLDAGLRPARAARRAREALAEMGLEEWADHLVEELSGGQQQRVAIARALAAHHRVLLADEPTSDLDGANRERVLRALRRAADGGAAVVVATHDGELAAAADAELVLDDGVASWRRRAG